MSHASAQAAALIDLARIRGGSCTSAYFIGDTPDMLMGAGAQLVLGGYVLCGLNTTRRGEALARDIAKVDCQLLITDAVHRPLLDDLELPGVTLLDTSEPQWTELLTVRPPLTPAREVSSEDTFMMIFTSGHQWGTPMRCRWTNIDRWSFAGDGFGGQVRT